MAHILLLDVPGGNDFTILEDAVSMGHEITFYTSDVAHYERQGSITQTALSLANEVVEINPFDYAAFEKNVLARHSIKPFDAVLCLIDIRIVEASRIAAKLGLRFLNLNSAQLLRDKFSVREMLIKKGIRQPRFALARSIDELREAVAHIGYPALIKPSDGYGSQNIAVLHTESDLTNYCTPFLQMHRTPTDYGLGSQANNRFLVEQYIRGQLVGCDVFSDGANRVLLGVNEKLMFAPPSFAIRGSCFPAARADIAKLRDYAFALLDAVEFDIGAAHIELIVADDGPYLVEINPRLVSAQIPYQMAYALERSVYIDLINLHLGVPVSKLPSGKSRWFSAIRWITAPQHGILDEIILPHNPNPLVRRVALFKEKNDPVRPPLSNGDRIGYVIAVGETQNAAEALADQYVSDTEIIL